MADVPEGTNDMPAVVQARVWIGQEADEVRYVRSVSVHGRLQDREALDVFGA
jgi:hypothetical protein